MSFQLQVEFVGLCLFVPDPGTSTLRVLMPAVSGEHGVEPHLVRLCFDTACLQPGSAAPSGNLQLVPMERLELPLAAPGPLDLALPAELVDVGAVARRPVFPGALYADDPEERLSARVTARSGSAGASDQGACWNYPAPNQPRQLPNRIRWTMGPIEGERLELVFEPLLNGVTQPLPPLYPINGTLALSVWHTPEWELPPPALDPGPPAKGTPAHHFAAYYKLFESPVATPLPTFVARRCGVVPDGDFMYFGGSPYTCMAAQSPPTPPA